MAHKKLNNNNYNTHAKHYSYRTYEFKYINQLTMTVETLEFLFL